jgi:hypothetical protein
MPEIIEDTIDNIREGGKVVFSNGQERIIEPHPCRVHLEIRGMALYDFYYYPEGPQEADPGADTSDVIQMILTAFNQDEPTGWLMNVQDALAIIHGLSTAAGLAIEDGIPVAPVDESEEKNNVCFFCSDPDCKGNECLEESVVYCRCGGEMSQIQIGDESYWKCSDCGMSQIELDPEQKE